MRKYLIVVLTVLMFGLVNASVSFYDELSPEGRASFSEDWLETGEAYYEVDDTKNAKACFEYAINLYPMGEAAEQARQFMKEYFNETVEYDAVEMFEYYVGRAETREIAENKLNNYLMALEIKDDAVVFYEAAVLYYEMEDTAEACAYLKKAIDAGYADEIDADLKLLMGK